VLISPILINERRDKRIDAIGTSLRWCDELP
jgi:hypothetical protein